MVRSELSMGPLCVTRWNRTHQLTGPTKPNPTHYIWKKLGPKSIQLTIGITDAGVYDLTVTG